MNIPLTPKQQIVVIGSRSIYKVMQQILVNEQEIDRNREHLWTIGLAGDYTILYIELVSMGSASNVIAEPMEVYGLALQKRSAKIVVVHNHPGYLLHPSEEDKDMTCRLIQTGIIVDVPVYDHLIINETDYYSFRDSGLLNQLRNSKKHVPAYWLEEKAAKEAEKATTLAIATNMKKAGEPLEKIMGYTGLNKTTINRIKKQEPKAAGGSMPL